MSTEEKKTVAKRVHGPNVPVTRSETRARKKILLEEGVAEYMHLGFGDIHLPFEIKQGYVCVKIERPKCNLCVGICHPEARSVCPLQLQSSLLLKGQVDVGYWLEVVAIAMQAFSLYAITDELLPDGDATRIGNDALNPWIYVRYRSVSYWYNIGLLNIDQLNTASVHLSSLAISANGDERVPVVWQSVPQCFAGADELQITNIEMDMSILSQFTKAKEASFYHMNLQRIPVQLREMKLERMSFTGNNIQCVADEDIEPHLGRLSYFRCANGRDADLRGKDLSVLLSSVSCVDVWSSARTHRYGDVRRELREKAKLYHILTRGLAAAENKSNNAWSTFLTRGIYDMRLFLFIWPFVQDQ